MKVAVEASELFSLPFVMKVGFLPFIG